ncbi:MAG: threonylcarbamoyl-AMP synthase [Bacteroidetes bacterium SB0662_bin_6]|nr:threonylcarbamoyl-AMP synthase [Bacteroidetes bacterium SB0668_bin_1]MYE05043.1 threonylcarbamoyl-AMP synthase [Bacteroidetes bacterium SB0662_bin_6]
MKTIVTDSPEEAASFIRSGETAAFPTETVYGLGADAFNTVAVRKIFEAKGRPTDNPLIAHIADVGEVDQIADFSSMVAQRLAERFFPGPLTLVLPKRPDVPPVVTAGLDTIAVRAPEHKMARALLRACARPVAAPSANRSGRPSPTTWQAVLEDLDGRIPCVLRGKPSIVGLESTVIDCTTDIPRVLRLGGVSLEALREVVPDMQGPQNNPVGVPRSPGLRHRHYAPTARVILVDKAPSSPPREKAGYIGMESPGEDTQSSSEKGWHLVERVATPQAYAHHLFDFMRRCDAAEVETIYCQTVEPTGIGAAIMDRLQRAARGSAGSHS